MAIRPVYLVSNGKVIKSEYEFQWYAGFSVAQKQRSIAALHNAVKSANKEANPLEISTKGTIDLGVKLSAFNLKLDGYIREYFPEFQSLFKRRSVSRPAGA